jgi:hypothetical protein
MARKNKQKQHQKTAAKRKQKKAAVAKKKAALAHQREHVDGASGWPIFGCWISEGWRDPNALVQILVARRRPAGGLAAAVILVDTGCLGVKNALVEPYISPSDLDTLRGSMFDQTSCVPCEPALAAKVIREAAQYAADLGFAPHPDFRKAWPLLEDIDPEGCDEAIPLGGEDGKPYYFAGPHDDVEYIMGTLVHRLGPDGFHYVTPMAF